MRKERKREDMESEMLERAEHMTDEEIQEFIFHIDQILRGRLCTDVLLPHSSSLT